MSNGCTLREDLLEQVRDLAAEGRFDYLLIESTGISEPLPVATTFDFRDEDGNSLSDVSQLDTMVTVVDGANLIKNYSSIDFLRDQEESLGDEDELDTAKAIIRGLNAKAKIIETNQSEVNLDEVMDTGLFDFAEAHEHPMWAQELYHFEDHIPQTEEYGIVSFVYNARAPFDPAKIHGFFNQEWPGVVRAKGFFWVSTRPDFVGEVSQVGAVVRHQGIGRWWAAVPQEQWAEGPQFDQVVKQRWNEDYGDRRQEIVFIGLKTEMDEQKIRVQLDACLIKDYLVDPHTYENLRDPFPIWFRQAA